LDALSKEDHAEYLELSSRFRTFIQTRRHATTADFPEQLKCLHAFITKSASNQSLRAMLCGIFFGRGFILVNTFRLKELLVRSKSGVNHCFQTLGYGVMRPSKDLNALFQVLLPRMDPRSFQLTQWCLRIETEDSAIAFPSHIPEAVAATFEVERIPPKEDTLLNREPPSVGRGTFC
jgi:hypothetical protein